MMAEKTTIFSHTIEHQPIRVAFPNHQENPLHANLSMNIHTKFFKVYLEIIVRMNIILQISKATKLGI